MKELKTQAELDAHVKLNPAEWACVTGGNFVAWGQSHVVAWGQSHIEAREQSHVVAREQSHVEAWGQSHVEAWGQSHIEAWGQSHVEAREQSHVEAREQSHVEAREQSHVEARGQSHVVAWGQSHVVAWGQSHIEAWEQSHVEAWGQSHVEAWGQSHVEAWGQSHVEAREQSHVVAREQSHVEAYSPYVSILCRSSYSDVSGGNIVGNTILSATEWLKACNVSIKRGCAILYKSLNLDFTSQDGFRYPKRGWIEAPDWDASSQEECGKGLHFSPTAAQAKSFRNGDTFIACKVKISDMANLPAYAQYPDKIRAKGCYVLYQCDENGKRR